MVSAVLAAEYIYSHQNQAHQRLFNTQLNKFSTTNEVCIAFFGDSALGNAIDAKLFSELSGQKSINLALTGKYGYAGSYNMIKRAVREYRLSNVILMHTPDMMTRSVAYGGYFHSIDSFEDIWELSYSERGSIVGYVANNALTVDNLHRFYFLTRGKPIGAMYTYWEDENDNKHWVWVGHDGIPVDWDHVFENDYIKQSRKVDDRHLRRQEGEALEILAKVSTNKDAFLRKIVALCKKHDINLVYVHGPVYQPIAYNSTEYIVMANDAIKNTGVEQLVENLVPIPIEEIGDASVHIDPNFKAKYTRLYYRRLTPYLRVDSREK